MIVLDIAIKNQDQKMINDIVWKIKKENWKSEIIKEIEKSHFWISLHSRHKKWREIYFQISWKQEHDNLT